MSRVFATQWIRLAIVVLGLVGLSEAADPPQAASERQEFPSELVDFVPYGENPVFTGRGPGHWDAKIRERGWIERDGDVWHLWYTGYDGTREGMKMLGYATSPDGLHWTRYSDEPIYRDHWVEDLMVVRQDGKWYMFAEGLNDQAQLLTSTDRIHWAWQGQLDVRYTNGKPLTPGPYGTPTAWYEDGTWHLFYERSDKGVWLATSKDLKVWTNKQDEPVLLPGPGDFDRDMIAMNQIIKHEGRYYALYHGTSNRQPPPGWTTAIAMSTDLVHWKKYPENPLLGDNKSSGILVRDGQRYRLYSMHDQVQVHFPKERK